MAHLRPYLPTNHMIAFGPFAWFDMVLSSNSRSAENPDTKGLTRFAFFEVGVLDSVRADRRDLYIGVLPIRSSILSTPALPRLWRPPRIPTTHLGTLELWPGPAFLAF